MVFDKKGSTKLQLSYRLLTIEFKPANSWSFDFTGADVEIANRKIVIRDSYTWVVEWDEQNGFSLL